MSGRAPGAGQPAEEAQDELADARVQAAEEAKRLRAAKDAPEHERRELLADLGTRLNALVRHLAGIADTAKLLTPLRDLVAELEADRPLSVPADVFEELWMRALRLLDDLAAGSSRKGVREFWKKVR